MGNISTNLVLSSYMAPEMLVRKSDQLFTVRMETQDIKRHYQKKESHPRSPRGLIIKVQRHCRQETGYILSFFDPELDQMFDLHREKTVRATGDLHRAVLAVKDDGVLFAVAHASRPTGVRGGAAVAVS